MTKDDFAKIGLAINKYIDHYSIKVANWEKFFPLVNLPVDGPLLQLAERTWYAYVLHYNYGKNRIKFDICVRSINVIYHTTSYYKYEITVYPEKDYIFKLCCPYDKDDIRRYLWSNIINQFDYNKIFKNIRKTLALYAKPSDFYFPEK